MIERLVKKWGVGTLELGDVGFELMRMQDGESSGTEIVECDDEEEFEEVMRILGLQQATVLENGDLRCRA